MMSAPSSPSPGFPVPPPPPDAGSAAISEAPPQKALPEVKPPATYEDKRREQPPARESLRPPAPPAPAVRRVTLPDEVVVRAVGTGQSLFLRCFRRATADDPALGRVKVRLHLELDADGRVTAASTDSDNDVLDKCLVRVGHMLPFPAPRQPAVVDMPLFFGG